jgi:transcriptional regulator of acetoin/glycerol metabolism
MALAPYGPTANRCPVVSLNRLNRNQDTFRNGAMTRTFARKVQAPFRPETDVSHRSSMPPALPSNPFFHTPEQRATLARQRFFDEGERPSGLVSEAVIQSWARCVGEGRRPTDRPSFDPVSRSRASAVLTRNHSLLEAAQGELTQLDQVLAGTHAKAILTDRHGVVIRATPTDRSEGTLLFAGTRVGVDLGEVQMGTAAPGVAARTRHSCTVLGPEHFFADVRQMYCAAAPIHDAKGQLVGVLDLSIEGRHFGFDAHALVRVSATAIENRLMSAQSRHLVLMSFQTQPGWLGTPMAGLAAVDTNGRVGWVNAIGASLLGCRADQARGLPAAECLGLSLPALLARSREPHPQPFHTPAGLVLWAGVQGPAQQRHTLGVRPEPHPAPSPLPREAPVTASVPASAPTSAASLADANQRLIEATLAAHGGNVSRAAKALGVSRGLLYRRMKQAGGQLPATPDDQD